MGACDRLRRLDQLLVEGDQFGVRMSALLNEDDRRQELRDPPQAPLCAHAEQVRATTCLHSSPARTQPTHEGHGPRRRRRRVRPAANWTTLIASNGVHLGFGYRRRGAADRRREQRVGGDHPAIPGTRPEGGLPGDGPGHAICACTQPHRLGRAGSCGSRQQHPAGRGKPSPIPGWTNSAPPGGDAPDLPAQKKLTEQMQLGARGSAFLPLGQSFIPYAVRRI